MATLRAACFLALLTCVCCVKMHTQTELHLNPLRRVVTLMQMMQKKVTEEGEKGKELYNKFMCHCQTAAGDLSKSIDEAEMKIPQLQSAQDAGSAEKTQLTSDVAQAQDAKAAAQKTKDEAKSIRSKEASAYAKQSAGDKANAGAIVKALAELKSGATAVFLQSSGVDVLRRFAKEQDLPEWDKHTLASFLSAGQGDADSQKDDSYEPDSEDIIGIVSQMKETLDKDITEADATEKKGLEDYSSLVLAKSKEVGALSKELETKMARLGEVGVELVNVADDIANTDKLLTKDKAFSVELDKSCKTKSAEWEERSLTRSDELVALSETIDLLNNDDALHLFKNTLPTTSLIQLHVSTRQLLHNARQALAKHAGQGQRDPRLDLINMAMHGRKVNFAKVLSMIEQMISLLGKEQQNDVEKRSYCKAELDNAEDDTATFENSISDSGKTIANSRDILDTLTMDLSKLAASIKALDKSAAEATQLRKSENAAYVEELASNNAAAQILNVARDRLNKFYNPTQFLQSKPKETGGAGVAVQHTFRMPVQDAVQDAVQVEAAAGDAVQDAFSFVQVSQAKGGAGIIKMLNTLIGDIKTQVGYMQFEEKDTQKEYQRFMRESSEKHADAAKALSAKEFAKAEREVSVQKHSKELKTATSDAMANAEYLQALHKECDWMLKNFGVRQDARTTEISALKQAKAVLSGADYSFLQIQTEVKRSLRAVAHH